MPSQYGADALLGLTLGSNLLALPNTLEQGYTDAERNRALLANPDVVKSLGVPQELLAQYFPTSAPMGAETLHQGMQVPVLGSVLRGIGTTGQLLQTVLGTRDAAPRPPLAELAALARSRQSGEFEERRLGLEQQRIGQEQTRISETQRYHNYQMTRPPGGKSSKSFVVGEGGTPDATGTTTQDGTSLMEPTGAFAPQGLTVQDFNETVRWIHQQVKTGQMDQATANAHIFGLKESMKPPPEDTTSADSSMPPDAQKKTAGSGIRYGVDMMPVGLKAEFAELGIDPRSFTQEDVKRAQDLKAKRGTAAAVDKAKQLQPLKDMALTTTSKTMIERAPKVINAIDRMERDLAGTLTGPGAGRWKEFWTGDVGLKDPNFAKLRSDAVLLASALTQMHVGNRPSEFLINEFKSMLNTAQDPENLRAVMGNIRDYAIDVGQHKLTPEGAGLEGSQSTTGGRTPTTEGGTTTTTLPRQEFDMLLKQYGG